MDKFGRNFNLYIQRKDGTTLKISPPFTVEFDIHRNSLSSANVAQFRIYNLAPDNRTQIRKNQYDTSDQRTISFYAGYGKNLALGFTGNITQAWSVREGNNMITQVECFDGGDAYVNAITADQFPKGTAQQSIVEGIANSLGTHGVQKGAIGNFEGTISRGNTYNGNTLDVLGEVTGNAVFIDNGKVHCLKDEECLAGSIPLINAATGLLGTPLLEQQYIHFDMLFEPGLKIGQLVNLQTVTADKSLNGAHKIISLQHRGVISEAVCGSAVTSVGLLPGSFTPISEAQS